MFPSAIVCSGTLLLHWTHDFAKCFKTRKKRVTVIRYRLGQKDLNRRDNFKQGNSNFFVINMILNTYRIIITHSKEYIENLTKAKNYK